MEKKQTKRCLQDGFKETKREQGIKPAAEMFGFGSFHRIFLGWCRCYRCAGRFTRPCGRGVCASGHPDKGGSGAGGSP